MRKRISGRKFNRTISQRKHLLQGLVADLILHERIVTTLPKAKEVRRKAEKLVTKAQKQTLAANREIFSEVGNATAAQRLINETGKRFAGRPGGYTRILKMDNRLGDNAQRALLEWVVKPIPKPVGKKVELKKAKKPKEATQGKKK